MRVPTKLMGGSDDTLSFVKYFGTAHIKIAIAIKKMNAPPSVITESVLSVSNLFSTKSRKAERKRKEARNIKI